jgi:tetratricopeptide (TPR) repeat protein
VVLAVTFVALLNVPGGPLAPLARLPGLDRLARLTHTDSGSTAARITIWRATLPLVAARPVLGYGPEGMRAAFARVFPPQLVYYEGRHVVDRAHNLWLDLGMSAGLAGVLAFTALVAGFGRLAWRGLRTAPEYRERAAWVALAAAVAGSLADLQFSFGLTASSTVLWLVLALASAMSRDPSPVVCAEERTGASSPLLYLPLTLVVLALVGLVCLRPLLADGAGWRALQPSPLPERRAAAQRAVRLWPLEPEYRLLLAEVLQEGGEFAAAEAQLAEAVQLSPSDPWLRAAQGTLYARWAGREPARLLQAEAAYRESLALAPNLAPTHAALGAVLARQGRLEEGSAELERAVALDASNKLAYRHLTELYRMLGRE